MADDPVPVPPDSLRGSGDGLRFLAEAGELLASSLDYRQTLASIAELAVPRLADFVLIDLLQPDGSVVREHTVHVDASREEPLRELAPPARVDPQARTDPSASVLVTGEPVFLPDVATSVEEEKVPPEQLRVIRAIQPRSLITAPLVARDRILGAITVGLSERDGDYNERHLELVLELARRAALAVEHALLYRTAEAARAEAERARTALQQLLKASDHLIIEFDGEGRYLSVEPASAPLIYRPPEALVGRSVHEVFSPPTASTFAEWIRTALRERRSVEIEYPLTIDGRRVWLAGSVSPTGGETVVWVVRDVTSRKLAEEALAESEKRFRATFDQAAVGISHIDMEGRFLRVNRRLGEIVGYSREELLRMTFTDITHPDDRTTHVLQSERLLSGDIDSYSIEKRYLRKSGEPVWVLVTGSLVRKDSGHADYFISVVQDIDDRKELEEQLIRAQKMEAVGRLAGGVAHEFNNALTTITGFSDLVLRGMDPDDPHRPDLEEISRAAWRAAGVSNRLMVFSSKHAAQPEVLDLGAVVANAERMLAQLAGEDVDLQVHLDAAPTRVHADRNQLEQALVNVVVNARDAMPDGGRLTIETAAVELDRDAARRLRDVVPGPYVALTVRDTGEGMTLEVQERIFDPFFTTKPSGKGTGLGLSIVYGIIQRAGGTVEVESEPGHGTALRIYLPRAEGARRGVVAYGEMPALSRRGGRILVVEDDAGVRMLAERVLTRLGYEVLVGGSAEEALSLLTADPRPLDLLVTDLVMPGMSGRELAQALESLQPGLPVLYTSGYAPDRAPRSQMAEMPADLLEKPFTPEELERAIRRTMDR